MGDMIRCKRIYNDVISAYIYTKVYKRKKERSKTSLHLGTQTRDRTGMDCSTGV